MTSFFVFFVCLFVFLKTAFFSSFFLSAAVVGLQCLINFLTRLILLPSINTEPTIPYRLLMADHLNFILRSQYRLCFVAQMEQRWGWLLSIPSVSVPGTVPALDSKFSLLSPRRTVEAC